jgi:hypothetical protein
MVTAGAIGVLMVMLGIGNLIEEDGGPLYGQLILLAFMVTGAGLILAGLFLQRTQQARGSKLVALGVAPGAVGVAFFWFPPALAVGVLAIVTSWKALTTGREIEREAVSA